MYGEVEAGLYWHRALVPWLLENIHDLEQSIFDPSLLFSTKKPMAILLCTDDTLVVMPESLLPSESTIEKRFKCRARQFLPTDFKGVGIIREGHHIILPQMTHIDTKGKSEHPDSATTKPDLHRELNDEEISAHRSIAGRLAWIGTGTSPTSAFLASMALQGKKKTVALLNSCREAYAAVPNQQLASLRYVPLDFATIHNLVYSDGSFQNLPDKHSQIGFVFFLADGSDRCNLFHWHSSRATRRPSSTEEAELLALDVAFLGLRNQRRIMFQLLKKEVPIVVYIDNQKLWQNLMKTTAPSMPEVMYRCHEQVNDEIINSVCLIDSNVNPADAMTKKKPNQALLEIISSNKHTFPVKRVFVLQHSLYRHSTFIPTSHVPMQEGIIHSQPPQPESPSSSSSPSASSLPSHSQPPSLNSSHCTSEATPQ